jgi:hypothetical protein
MVRARFRLATLAAVALGSAALLLAGPLDPPSGPVAPTYKTLSRGRAPHRDQRRRTRREMPTASTGSRRPAPTTSSRMSRRRRARPRSRSISMSPPMSPSTSTASRCGERPARLYGIVSRGFGHIECLERLDHGIRLQDGMELDCRDYRVERVTFTQCLRGLSAGGHGSVSDCALLGDRGRCAEVGRHRQRRTVSLLGLRHGHQRFELVCGCRMPGDLELQHGLYRRRARTASCAIASAVANGGEGFVIGSNAVVSRCVAQYNQIGFLAGEWSVFEACTSDGNTDEGFWTADSCIFRACSASTNQLQGFRAGSSASFENCSAYANSGTGFYAGQKSTFVNCRATLGNGGGFEAGPISVFTDCVASENSGGSGFLTLENATFAGCRASTNANRGFQTTSRTSFTDCEATNNGSLGFETTDQSTLSGCLAANNGAGISGTDGVTVSGMHRQQQPGARHCRQQRGPNRRQPHAEQHPGRHRRQLLLRHHRQQLQRRRRRRR